MEGSYLKGYLVGTFSSGLLDPCTRGTGIVYYIELHSCRGKRGIKVTGALRSAGFQKIPARPQIVFNRFTGLNMLV